MIPLLLDLTGAVVDWRLMRGDADELMFAFEQPDGTLADLSGASFRVRLWDAETGNLAHSGEEVALTGDLASGLPNRWAETRLSDVWAASAAAQLTYDLRATFPDAGPQTLARGLIVLIGAADDAASALPPTPDGPRVVLGAGGARIQDGHARVLLAARQGLSGAAGAGTLTWSLAEW